MTLNDFQCLTMASLGESTMIEHVRAGVRALCDHVDEAKDAAAKMEKADTADAYVDERERLTQTMGFLLVDIAEVCEGLNELLGDVARENLCELVRIRKMVDAANEPQDEPKESILRKAVALMQGMLDSEGEEQDDE